eukprot:TRINITY_DN12939_c0_g1_i2.p1 TRINITY_DN12939_c0_g1~~TRINITY_DN12939_c0_g1_i2.p1  ORF type:complete len:1827 (+),score=604.90 TRINITY_DN12939_c0_g1_i2:164-5644(+)
MVMAGTPQPRAPPSAKGRSSGPSMSPAGGSPAAPESAPAAKRQRATATPRQQAAKGAGGGLYICVSRVQHRVRKGSSFTSDIVGFVKPGDTMSVHEVRTVEEAQWGRVDDGWMLLTDAKGNVFVRRVGAEETGQNTTPPQPVPVPRLSAASSAGGRGRRSTPATPADGTSGGGKAAASPAPPPETVGSKRTTSPPPAPAAKRGGRASAAPSSPAPAAAGGRGRRSSTATPPVSPAGAPASPSGTGSPPAKVLKPQAPPEDADEAFDLVRAFLDRPQGVPAHHTAQEVVDCAAVIQSICAAKHGQLLTESELRMLLDAAVELAETAAKGTAVEVCRAHVRIVDSFSGIIDGDQMVPLLVSLLPLSVVEHRAAAHAAVGAIFRAFPQSRNDYVTALCDHFLPASGETKSTLHLGALLAAAVHAEVPPPHGFANGGVEADAQQRVQGAAQHICEQLLARTVDNERAAQPGASGAPLARVVEELLHLALSPRHPGADLLLYRLLWLMMQRYVRAEGRTDRGLAAAVEVMGRCAHRHRLVYFQAKEGDPAPPAPQGWYKPPSGMPSPEQMRADLQRSEPLEERSLPALRELSCRLGVAELPAGKEEICAAVREHVRAADLGSKDRAALVELAKQLGVKGATAMKKAALKEAVEAKQTGGEAEVKRGVAAVAVSPDVEAAYAACLRDVASFDGARQFLLLQWYWDYRAAADAAVAGLKGIAARAARHAAAHRAQWILGLLAGGDWNLPLAGLDTAESQSASQQSTLNVYSHILIQRPKSVMSAYGILIRQLVSLFSQESTPAPVKRRVTTHVTDLMDVDPSIIETVWPAVARGLRDDTSSPVAQESLLEILRMVLEKLDRFDAHLDGPDGRSGAMVRKMLGLVLRFVDSRSIAVSRKALRALHPILQSPHIAERLRIRVLGELLRGFSTLLPAVKQEVIALAQLVFTLPASDPAAQKKSPAVLTAVRIAQWVSDECGASPTLEFSPGRPSRPSVLVEAAGALLLGAQAAPVARRGRQSRKDKDAKGDVTPDAPAPPTAALPCAEAVVAEWLRAAAGGGGGIRRALALCCCHLTALSAPSLLAGRATDAMLSGLQHPPADAGDEQVAVFLHSAQIVAHLGSLRDLPGARAAAALEPLMHIIKSYAGKHSQRVIAAAVLVVGSSCAAQQRGSAICAEHLKIAFMSLTKTCRSLRQVYIPLLQQQPDKQDKVLPTLLRSAFIVSTMLQAVDWGRGDIRDACTQFNFGEGLPNVLYTESTDGVYGHVYSQLLVPLMQVVVTGESIAEPARDKIVSVLLRVVSVLCMRGPHTYFPLCRELIAVALRKQTGMTRELHCAALEVVRDFLVDEEERIEAAHKRQKTQGSGSKSQDSIDENSGMATTLMGGFLKHVLSLLHSQHPAVRELAMEVTELCYHQGLSLPMLAMGDLIGAATAHRDADIGPRAVALVEGFVNRQQAAGSVVPKAAAGLAAAFTVRCEAEQESLEGVRGHTGTEGGAPVSDLAFLYRILGSHSAQRVGLVREVLRALHSPAAADAAVRRFGLQRAALLYYPRYLVELVGFLPITREPELMALLSSIDRAVALAEEETLQALSRLVGDENPEQDTPPKRKRGDRESTGSRARPRSTVGSEAPAVPPLPPAEELAPLVFRAYSLVCLLELKGFLKKDYGITARRLEAARAAPDLLEEPAKGRASGRPRSDTVRRKTELGEVSEAAQEFLDNIDVVSELCDVGPDGKMTFTVEHISDLRDSLRQTIMAEASELWSEDRAEKELKKKARKAAEKEAKRRKRREEKGDDAESEESEESSDSSSEESSKEEAPVAPPAKKPAGKRSSKPNPK